jgi:hypothetical protein
MVSVIPRRSRSFGPQRRPLNFIMFKMKRRQTDGSRGAGPLRVQVR